ncbi:MAG TPA: sugar phosphate isomerase/epimerase [Solirubrobacterales bacterium]|nr:sugar phosphate isomerase/epimerase [Solirubrobacterales bacterium]
MEVITERKPSRLLFVVGLAAVLAFLVALVGPRGATAQQPPKADPANCATGRTVPASKISIQLWTFNRYIGSGARADEAPEGAPGPEASQAERLEFVFEFLSEVGYTKIEPFSFHGLTVEEFKALADEYGLKVPSRHMSTNPNTWEANLADAKLLGQHMTGSGGFAPPGIGSYENTLATAETLNQLGELSKKNGTGPIFGHNHRAEFTTMYVDAEGDGTLKSAWQILAENTDPRYVDFQLDVGWATIAGVDAPALIEQYGDRISSLHVKDAIVFVPDQQWEQVTIGQGDVDWEAVFQAAQGKVRYYIIEQDPPVEPFSFAAESFEYVDCLVF